MTDRQSYVAANLKDPKDPKKVVDFWKQELGDSLKIKDVNGIIVISEYIVSDYAPSQLMPSHWKWLFSCGNASAYSPARKKVTISDIKAIVPHTKGAIKVSGNCVVMRYPNMTSANPSYKCTFPDWNKVGSYTEKEWIWNVFCADNVRPEPEKDIAKKIGLIPGAVFINTDSWSYDLKIGSNKYKCLEPWGDNVKKSLIDFGAEEVGGIIKLKGTRDDDVRGFKDNCIRFLSKEYSNNTSWFYFGDSIDKILKELGAEKMTAGYLVKAPGNYSAECRSRYTTYICDGLVAFSDANFYSNIRTVLEKLLTNYDLSKAPAWLKEFITEEDGVITCKKANIVIYKNGFKPDNGFNIQMYDKGREVYTNKGVISYDKIVSNSSLIEKKTDNVFVTKLNIYGSDYNRSKYCMIKVSGKSILINERPGSGKYSDADIKLLRDLGIEAVPQGSMLVPPNTKVLQTSEYQVRFIDGAMFIRLNIDGRLSAKGWEDLNQMPGLLKYGKVSKVAWYMEASKIAKTALARTLQYKATGWTQIGSSNSGAQAVQPQPQPQQGNPIEASVGKWKVWLTDKKQAESIAKANNTYVNVTDTNWDAKKLRVTLKLLYANDLCKIEGTGWSYVDDEFADSIPFTDYYKKAGTTMWGLIPKEWATDRRAMMRISLPGFETDGRIGCNYHIPSYPIKYMTWIEHTLSRIITFPRLRDTVGNELKKLFGKYCNVTSQNHVIEFEESVWWDDFKKLPNCVVDEQKRQIQL